MILGRRTPEQTGGKVDTGPSPNLGRAGAPPPPSGFRGSGTPRGGFGRNRKPPPAPKRRAAPKPSDYAGQGLDHAEAQVLIDMGIAPHRVAHLARQHAPGHPAAQGPPDQGGGAGTPTPGSAAAAQQGGINDFLGAIRTHESSGNYGANSGDGAYGAYQYIPATWNSMAKAAGYGQYANGRADLAPPAVQDAVARYDAGQKFKDYGGNFNDMAQAWFDPAYVGQSNYAPPGNNGLTMGEYGAQITKLMGQGTGVVDPAGAGLTLGRTDQGVDWRGTGPLYATGAGTIESVKTGDAGWPGGTYIDLRLANPPDPQHSDVYYAEDINPAVKAGEQVAAGQQVGTATGGSSGIELGWGNPAAMGQPLNQVTQGRYGGTGATPQGQSFLDYISGGSAGAGGVVDTGGGGGSTGAAGSSTGTTGAQAIADAASTNLFANLPNLYGVGTTGQSAQSLQAALSGLAANPQAATQMLNTTNAPGSPDQPASESQKTQTPTAAQYQAILQALLPGISPGSAGKNG